MLERLKGLFGKNKKEIKEIEENHQGKESSVSKEEHKAILENANTMIENLNKATRQYDETEDLRQKNACRKEVIHCEDVIKKSSQGKLKDVISGYFGQIDKRIHNKLYSSKSALGNKLWERHVENVNQRYQDLPGYITKNSFLVLLFSGASVLLGHYANVYGELLSTLSYMAMGASGLVSVNMIAKTASTYFDKKKYGDPLLVQEKQVYNGSYIENIRNANCALQMGKLLTGESQFIESEKTISLPSNEEFLLEDEVAVTGEIEVNDVQDEPLLQEELVEPNIRDYGNINFGFMEANAFYQTEEGKISYAKAISAARKVDANNASGDDIEKKIAAYDKLYQTFGKGKPRKKKEHDSNKKLNDYNQTLKLLSEYGRKVHDKTATEKEYNTYIGLLYHLGKDDDFITDFLSDEYDRYLADKEAHENKVLKKTIDKNNG